MLCRTSEFRVSVRGEMMSMVWDTKRKMGRMAQKILS